LFDQRLPPCAAQRADDDRTAAAVEVALFANLCEVSPDTLDGMDLGDFHRLQEAYEGFSRGSTSGEDARS